MKVNKRKVNINYSIIQLLKDQNKISDSLLVTLNSLSIEEILAVKLELSATHLNHRLYGFDMWRKFPHITKEALLKFALSTTSSKKDAARFLGLTYGEFKRVVVKYKTKNFFSGNL